MFITDKLTEIAIAICNEFRHWVWVFPHHSFDLLDVASSQLSSVVLFYYYFFSFSVFFMWRRLDRVDLHYKCTCVDRQLCAKITTVPRRIRHFTKRQPQLAAFGTFAFLFTFDFTHNFHGKVHSTRRSASEITFKTVGRRLNHRFMLSFRFRYG